MRDWVIGLIVLLILGILLDGVRRWRKTRRENLQLSRKVEQADKKLVDKPLPSSDFPSGGARVVKQREPQDAFSVNSNLRETFESSRVTAGARGRIPQQVSLNLNQTMPQGSLPDIQTSEHREPTIHTHTRLEELDDDTLDVATVSVSDLSRETSARHHGIDARSEDEQQGFWGDRSMEEACRDYSDEGELASVVEPELELEESHQGVQQTDAAGVSRVEGQYGTLPNHQIMTPENHLSESAETENVTEQTSGEYDAFGDVLGGDTHRELEEFIEPEEVLIFNVTARGDACFSGPELLDALMAENMKFGDMNIFHRHANDDGSGPVLFSLANMVMPGSFNLAAISEFETPGLSMFLSLPLPASLEAASESSALDTYNLMSLTAQSICGKLGGILKDENRSVMTLQTIEHGRQRVIEFQRKRRLAFK